MDVMDPGSFSPMMVVVFPGHDLKHLLFQTPFHRSVTSPFPCSVSPVQHFRRRFQQLVWPCGTAGNSKIGNERQWLLH